ncbi:MAG: hypothetical protein ABIH59_01695 [archaeon]
MNKKGLFGLLIVIIAVLLVIIVGLVYFYTPWFNNKIPTELKECESEQDCIDIGKCSAGLECTCSYNKCYTGYVAECAGEGEMCGGFVGVVCCDGEELICDYGDDYEMPDAAGVCELR